MNSLPTFWNLYNLQVSPYFQGRLSATPASPAPLSLFVGRTKELEELKGRIHGSGPHGSRHAIAGPPGVGKTTLVQELKSQLHRQGYFTTDAFVSVGPDDTSETLLGKVLNITYDTLVANRPHTVTHKAMQDAQTLSRTTRLGGRSMGINVAGVGVHHGNTATPITPKDLLIDGPRILRDLTTLIATSDGEGLVVHLNNLENLTEKEARQAAEMLRALRDTMLLQDRLHFLIVGTTDAVSLAVDTHAQVRSVVTTLNIDPLPRAEVHELLRARYEHLRYDARTPATPPVADQAVDALYDLYGGDLRSLLKALEDAVSSMLGARGATSLEWSDVAPALRARYGTVLDTFPDQQRATYLIQWGERNDAAPMTQEELERVWGVSRGTVSKALQALIQHGYVIAHPRKGRSPVQYSLSGTSRLIFGIHA